MARRERNRVVIAIVAVLIVGAAVYTPVALLAPLPETAPTAVEPDGAAPDAPQPRLSEYGASAVTLAATAEPIAGGATEPIPMAGTAKLVTALVVLEEHPIEAGGTGESIPVTAQDFLTYTKYRGEGTRAVGVVAGEQWTQRDVLEATVVASSNNHAEMLAAWAFGSTGDYLDAASRWLADNDLAGTSVADPTGLSASSTSTASDLARIAAMAATDPVLGEILRSAPRGTPGGRTFENTIGYRSADGIEGISRSYTDEAGVCVLFSHPVTIAEQTVTVYGAFIGEPSYEQLDADLDALMASLPAALTPQELITAGTAYGEYRTPWGARASAVASSAVQGTGWASEAGSVTIELDPVTTARKGARVGTAEAPEGDPGDATRSVLELDRPLSDPGPLWRLTNPGTVVPRFFDMVSGRG